MKKTMMSYAAAALLLALGASAEGPAKPPSTEDALVAQVAEAKWTVPKIPGFPSGVMASPIAVDPGSGQSVGYAKFAPGVSFPLHWHSATEYSVLISGKATLTVDGKTHDLVAGSYAVIPAKAQHKLDCAAGAECVILTRRAGPTDYHFVGKE
jgi:quercetin dioxygenase-like cupin family protein